MIICKDASPFQKDASVYCEDASDLDRKDASDLDQEDASDRGDALDYREGDALEDALKDASGQKDASDFGKDASGKDASGYRKPMSLFWTVDPVWDQETCFIIGGGPSVLDTDLTSIHGRKVIGVNNAFMLGPWIDVIYFGDMGWWPHNREAALAHPASLIVMSCNGKKKGDGGAVRQQDPEIKVLRRIGLKGLSTDRSCLAWNKSSGAAAINLALHFGATRIVLVGFDMKLDLDKGLNGGHNWHDRHARMAPQPRSDIYRTRFLPPFRDIAKGLDRINAGRAEGDRLEILNATTGSALDAFPMVDLDDVG